jgi:Gpi18-like mannosyltransferase
LPEVGLRKNCCFSVVVIGRIGQQIRLSLIFAKSALEPAAPSRGISLEVWNRWDSPAYLNIAQHGYTASLPNRAQLVLFPLYPLCVHAVAIVARNYLVSAFIVSGVGAGATALLLYRLTRLDASRAVAIRAVWLMLIFPSGFFLHIGYAESLFLALAIGCLYAAQTDRWAISGLMAAFAAMTRISGWLLIPTLATEVIQQFVTCRKWRRQWLWALMPLSGLAVYLLINKTTGHALAFLTIEREHWSKALDWPWKRYSRLVRSDSLRQSK